MNDEQILFQEMQSCPAPVVRPVRCASVNIMSQPRATSRSLWLSQLGDPTGVIRGWCHVCDHRVHCSDCELCEQCGQLVHGTKHGCAGNGPCEHDYCSIEVHGCSTHHRLMCKTCYKYRSFDPNYLRLAICLAARRHQAESPPCSEICCSSRPPVPHQIHCINPPWPPVDGSIFHLEPSGSDGSD